MSVSKLSTWGALLVEHLRDSAISEGNMALAADSTSVLAKRWREVPGYGPEMAAAIADIVDDTVMTLLLGLDEGTLKLRWKVESGEVIDLTKDGEGLRRRYLGPTGWRATYSKEQISEDDGDVATYFEPPAVP